MAERDWEDIPIHGELFENIDATLLAQTMGGMENCFVSESGGHTRFPGLEAFADLKDIPAPPVIDMLMYIYVAGRPIGGVEYMGYVPEVDCIMHAHLPGAKVRASVAPAADWESIIKLNGVTVGSAKVSLGETIGHFVGGHQVDIKRDDEITFVAPYPRDDTLKGLALTVPFEVV